MLMLSTIFTSAHNTGRKALAFSLIEIMVGLFIIGLGASMVVPRLLRRSPNVEWPALQQELNNMLYFARQEAITTQKVHRLTFDQKKGTVEVEIEDGQSKPGVTKFLPVYSTYFTTRWELPEGVKVEWIKLNKKELFSENKGAGWCYVVPNGLVQEVSLKLTRDDKGEVTSKLFVAAPFLGTFDEES